VVIVATVSAIYGIGEPESYHRMVMTLRAGDKMGQRDVIAQLVRMQYQRNDQDFTRGKFRVRGDTIDVFPAEHSELAIRIELFDDEIESLQLFDPLTGRIRQKIPRFTIYPSSHYVTPRDKVLAAVETIKLELDQRLKELVGMGKLVEAQRLEQRTRFDLEMLSEVGHCKGIENYTRHLSGAAPGEPPSTLTDYMPKRRADVPGREPPDDRPARRHVQRRPRAQDHAGGIRLSPAQRAGQPAPEAGGV
jgi:excinuclease ABC subunit B